MTARADNTIQVPPDRDPLARWQGDGLALLARLNEAYAELWLRRDLDDKAGEERRFRTIGQLIKVTREHFEEMPR